MFCVDEKTKTCKHIIQTCKQHNIDNVLIDITHPNMFKTNQFVKNEEIKNIRDKLLKFIKELTLNFIRVTLSKPLPYCIFSEEEFRYLSLGHRLRGTCKPGSDIVCVNPDLKVFPCLQMFIKGPKLTEFNSPKEYMEYFNNSIKELKWGRYLFNKCKDCSYYFNKECQGSCLCRKSSGFQVINKNQFVLYTQYKDAKDYTAQIQKIIQELERWFGSSKKLEFFQFDNKKDLKLYSCTYRYPDWLKGFASGRVYYQKGFIKSEKRLTHEICHLFVANFVNNDLPSWFNEGLCEFMAFGRDVHYKYKKLQKSKKQISFIKMMGTYQKGLLEFDSEHPDNNIAYQQSASLVAYIVEHFGFDIVFDLLRSGEEFYESIKRKTKQDFSEIMQDWELMVNRIG
ncbi:MAG: hypothetical protein ACOCZQ_03400 [Nanoarchaeota archaeon]